VIKIIKQVVDKKQPYLFSLSMGVDSLAAFIWMKIAGYEVVPIHFNHKLRPQNDLMEKKFLEFCKDFNTKSDFITHSPTFTVDTKECQTEADFRNLRIEFYKDISAFAKQVLYLGDLTPTIITAHHLNDYVESYLLNCFRGHPNHTPIELESEFNFGESRFKIIHPFLLTKKKDFVQFIERNNYNKYLVEDETNKVSKGSRRNWIRNFILPEMGKNKLSLEKFAKRKIESSLKLKSFMV
jgi:tRNA(Ile)-lysidine synthetase-like protein